ncbi:1-phosphatidylinositol-4-phosphate 5-kinase [Papiliotrema laurentii]|uniref:1-phosphatidylinositol-4-phosphate 5-kinase n=1 Tax=Papiliotrema laurentii TaxID=5418 RepID=A0AAD9CVH0_PAPLA|nr:1-phosphatidylinositol-4-phosphate 5-kinase [Papiliotrema laurentii]
MTVDIPIPDSQSLGSEPASTLPNGYGAIGDQPVNGGSTDSATFLEDRSPQATSKMSASPRINPFHLLSHPGTTSPLPPLPPHLQQLTTDDARQDGGTEDNVAPIHITKVKQDFVQISSGPAPDGPQGFFRKVSRVFTSDSNAAPIVLDDHAESTATPVVMQGPPPSPPISDAEAEPDSEDTHGLSEVGSETAVGLSGPSLTPLSERTEMGGSTTATPSLYTANLTAEPSELTASPSRSAPSHLVVPGRRASSSSTASRTGSLAVVRASRLAQQRNTGRTPEPEQRAADSADELSGEERAPRQRQGSETSLPGRPSPIATSGMPRISRRSTGPTPITPSSVPTRSPLLQTQSTFGNSRTSVPGLEGSALDSDILAHTEIIRRERLERRQKKADALENPPEPPATATKPEPKKEDPKVLVGNLIGEDHVNYVLMYNMLTGIRIGVSRCQAKMKRPLTDEDYVARHKFSFDIIGNELTPSAKYDFKFKDYAPWIFRDLRDEHFHLDPADYLLSLTAKYILSELGSPGKSGSFFYFSRDYRFIIKTISHSEHKFLRSILKDYHEHVKTNPHTLLSRFYGLHRVKLPRGRKIHFVIMNNLFPPHRDIHETFDLKGSAYGREYDEEKAKKNPKAVLKDKNWVNRGRTLELGPEKRALLSEQLRRDTEFLKRIKVMDYSLLVGIHNMERGNRDNLRENQLSVFHPEMPPTRRKPSTIKGFSEASNVRKAVRRSDPKMLDAASQLPSADSKDRRHFLFYQDEGGLRATDEANQSMDVIYYLGVIDICTPYNSVKKIEHFWKSLTEDRQTISCVDPVAYGQRFINFLLSVMRGGDISLRPVGLLPEGSSTGEKSSEKAAASSSRLKSE